LIVFDSIDVLLTLLDDRFAECREIYRLDDWISESGLTGIISAKSRGDDPFVAEGYGFMQFMTDWVVALKLRLVDQIALRYVPASILLCLVLGLYRMARTSWLEGMFQLISRSRWGGI
jgi:hypothetical protein